MKEVSNKIDALKALLADSYLTMLKAQNYHWNVQGKDFFGLHGAFQTQYEELFQMVDEIAERIRVFDEFVPASMEAYSELSIVKNGAVDSTPVQMVEDLMKTHQEVSNRARAFVKLAEDDGDVATADLFTQRIQAHDKFAWMLKSCLK